MGQPTFSHVINPVGAPVGSPLWLTQHVTFAGMAHARTVLGERLEIVTVAYPEDRSIVPAFARQLPDLEHSVLDLLVGAEPRRKLPFLADILATAYRHCDSDYVIFTNVDIIPGPDFYRFIARRVESGRDVFTINRRTVDEVNDPINNLSKIYEQRGRRHPGHDCFVFPRQLIKNFDLGRMVVGTDRIGWALLANLEALAGVQRLTGRRQTSHIGDDRSWRSSEQNQYRDHNLLEARGVYERLRSRHPVLDRHRYVTQSGLGLRWHTYGDLPVRSAPIPKIFCTSVGDADADRLTGLLRSADQVWAAPDAAPSLRDLPLKHAIATGRVPGHTILAKLAAVERTTESLPPGWTYAETTHLFIPMLADAAVERWQDEVTVVHVRRGMLDTIVSLLRQDAFSDGRRPWTRHLYPVPSRLTEIDLPWSFAEMPQIDRIIAYVFDAEEQVAAFMRRHPNVRVVEAALDALDDETEVERLLKELHLRPTALTRRIVRDAPVRGGRALSAVDADRQLCRERLERFIGSVDAPNAAELARQALAHV